MEDHYFVSEKSKNTTDYQKFFKIDINCLFMEIYWINKIGLKNSLRSDKGHILSV